MPGLDSYLVTLGIKGQDVVLSTMDKIRKKGGDLSKGKKTIELSAKTKEGKPSKTPEDVARETKTPKEISPTETTKKKDTEQEKNNKAFGEAAKKFQGSVNNFGSAAASLDPTATVQSITSAIGTSLSGISVLGVSLGRLPEGIAALSNSTISMAKNSIDMAKQNTLMYKELSTRNAMTAYYGGGVEKTPSSLSRNDMAVLVASVSGSMGKIQKPLADEISKLVTTKDTGALSRVAAGDWESTGTDKGWILQQIMNGVQGMPPSIKQSIQAQLLKSNAEEIQGYAPGQAAAQGNAAAFANKDEDQSARLYRESLSASGETKESILKLMDDFNSMQKTLMDTGLTFADAISGAIDSIEKLPATIDNMKKAMDDFTRSPSLSTAKNAIKRITAGN